MKSCPRESVDIPFFASCAGGSPEAGITVPSSSSRTVTEFGVRIVDSTEGAVKTDGASPAGSDWALANVSEDIEGLTSWAELDTSTAIPVVTITTSDAGLLDSRV